MPARIPVSPPLPPPNAGLEITTTDHGAEQKRANGKQKRDSARQEGWEPDFQPPRRSELRGARAPHWCIPHGVAHILPPRPAPRAPHADKLERGSSTGRRGENASRGRECPWWGGVVRRPRRGAQISTRAPRDGHSGPPGQKAGRPPPYAEARAPPPGFTRGVERLEKAGSGPPPTHPNPEEGGLGSYFPVNGLGARGREVGAAADPLFLCSLE